MEPTLDAVFRRLEKVEVKTYDSISAELYKIEDEFDKYIEQLYFQNSGNSGLVMFNWELKQKHQSIVYALLSKEGLVLEKVEEVKEPEIEVEPLVEPVGETIEPVFNIVVPVEIEIESPLIKTKATKPKVIKTEEL